MICNKFKICILQIIHNLFSFKIRLYMFLFFKLTECAVYRQHQSKPLQMKLFCIQSSCAVQFLSSRNTRRRLCLSDNKENNPHNPQMQLTTLNAGETEQLLKVYEIQLKLLTVRLLEVIFSTYTISYSRFPLHIF